MSFIKILNLLNFDNTILIKVVKLITIAYFNIYYINII